MISDQSDNVSAAFDGNTIDGTAATGYATTAGYTVWDTPTTGSVLVSGGSVTGVQYGVWVNSYEGYSIPAGTTHATISGVSISASQVGVYVEDSSANSSHPAVSATIENNTSITTNTTSGVGVEVSGANASATITGNIGSISGNAVGIDVEGSSATATTISGNDIYGNTTGIKVGGGAKAAISGNTFQNSAGTAANTTDLLVAYGAASVTLGTSTTPGNTFAATTYIDNESALPIDATRETFGAVGPLDTTLAHLYGVEDKITDAIDQSGLGFVRIRTGEVYVAHSSEDTALGGSAEPSSAASTRPIPARRLCPPTAIPSTSRPARTPSNSKLPNA